MKRPFKLLRHDVQVRHKLASVWDGFFPLSLAASRFLSSNALHVLSAISDIALDSFSGEKCTARSDTPHQWMSRSLARILVERKRRADEL
jgi:hypothetical protein